MYNLQQLSMFVEAAKAGSFSACARKLGKAQSAVSQGIANLELDLGNELFDRSSRKPKLTPQGERLLSYAQAVLSQVHELDCASLALGKHDESYLLLAIDSALFIPELEKILVEFSHKFPATALELITAASPDVMGLISAGKAHLGMMFSDMTIPDFADPCFVGSIPFYAVTSPSHDLAQHQEINVAQLIPHRQILLKGIDGRGLEQFSAMSAQVWWGNDFYLIRDLVAQGVGWAYIPCHMVEKDISDGVLHKLPLTLDHKAWSAPVDRIIGKKQTMGPALSWLANEVKVRFDRGDNK